MIELVVVEQVASVTLQEDGAELIYTPDEVTLIQAAEAGPQGPASSTEELAVEVRVDSLDSHLFYVGKAAIGSATSAPVWQIARLDDTSGLVKKWADGNAAFDNVYDDREALTYA